MAVASSLAPLANVQRPQVAVYRGNGAGLRSLRSAVASLERLLPHPFQVCTMSTEELLEGRWQQQCAMLVMPGGADLPYCRDLNGRGNELIREYVSSGGSYLGLCAGAYYACGRVEFEVGSRLQVVGDRELAFFPGVACGAAYPGFDYQTERGAVAAPIAFRVPAALQAPCTTVAAVGHSHGEAGGNSWRSAVDYCNGGPLFHVPAGPSSLTGARSSHNSSIGRSSRRSNGSSNGSSNSSSSSVEALPRVQVLAWYKGAQHPAAPASGVPGAVAAVRCEVGAGVAVLCGTHPELAPEWLDPCGSSTAADMASSVSASSAADGASILGHSQLTAHTLQHQPADARHTMATPLAAPVNETCQQQQQDVELVQHTAALRAALAQSQPARELFLACLVFEALRRPESGSQRAALTSCNAVVLA